MDQTPVPPTGSTSADDITGLIERVTFFNEETGFCVLRVKAGGHRDLVTVVGSLPSVSAGEWISAEGVWVRDKEYGLQLRVTTLNTVPPTTAEGIERYLGSGMVKGVGPVFAKPLVERFGAGVLAVIEHRPGDLESVEGIGPKREWRIVASFRGSFGSDSDVHCRSRERQATAKFVQAHDQTRSHFTRTRIIDPHSGGRVVDLGTSDYNCVGVPSGRATIPITSARVD